MKRNFLLLLFLATISYTWAGTPQPNFSGQSTGFLENKGQIKETDGDAAPYVQYVLERGSTKAFLLQDGIAWQFQRTIYPDGYMELMQNQFAEPGELERMDELSRQIEVHTYRMDMVLQGANPQAEITTEGRSKDYIHYYNHDVLDVHHYGKVIYHDIYPGIDWHVYTTEAGMKYDFVVHPGADPNQIQIQFKHQEELYLDEAGNLVYGNRMGEIREEAPVSFQGEKEIHSQFKLEDDVLSFGIGSYDPSQDLVIDPNLLWATYYGGTDTETIFEVTHNANGDIYFSGDTKSINAIAMGGYQNTKSGAADAYLVKFSLSGVREWATYYGGSDTDVAYSVTTNIFGGVFISGRTLSTSGIAFNGYQNTFGGGGSDAFLVSFNSLGSLQWATYYGGNAAEQGYHVVADSSGNIYLTGITASQTGIAYLGHQNTYGGGMNDGFLVKFDSSGTRKWATYYGGSDNESSESVAMGPRGDIYICGYTLSSNSIAFGGYQNVNAGGWDTFIARFDSTGNRLWATYYGSTGHDQGYDLDVLDSNHIFITGNSNSISGFSNNGYQNSYGGGSDDAFIMSIGAAGLNWATYFGASDFDFGYSISVSADGALFFLGRTGSTSGIASGGYQNTFGGGNSDAYIAEFDTSGSFQWASYFGGSGFELGLSVDDLGNGVVLAGGYTSSADTISLNGHQNYYGGGGTDAMLAVFGNCLPSYNSVTDSDCGSYTWSANGQTYTSSGTYTATLTNAQGCDSVLTLNLTILNNTSSSVPQTACDSYTWPENGQTYTSSGAYSTVLTNSNGCDSTITLNLTILNSNTGSESQTACDSYTWPANSQTYTTSGTYSAVLTNAAGCDSTVTLSLTINTVNTGVTQAGPTLTASASGATYQWIDCGNNMPVTGATVQSFTPAQSGDYAVIVTQNGCTDTSSCYSVSSTAVDEIAGTNLKIYPNPSSGKFILEWVQEAGMQQLKVADMRGKVILIREMSGSKMELDLSAYAEGVYILTITADSGSITRKLILEK